MIGIYGGNGFIGQHIVRRLVRAGVPVRVVSRRFDSAFRDELAHAVEFVEADFRDSLAMMASLQDIDTVVQLISSSSPGMGNQLAVADIQDNVVPHVAFIQNAISAGVKKYVFFSSGGTVYGPNERPPTPESAGTRPISSHGMTKLMIEKYLQMFGHVDGLNYTILRVSNPYGPGQLFRKGQGLIPAVLHRYREGRPITIIGDGRNERDFIYIDDLVDAVESVVNSPAVDGEILNIGSGIGHSVLDVIDTLERELGITFLRETVPARKTDVPRSILDISKARRLLGWNPRTSLAEGIRHLAP
jgi:UDP-glucose 4-epimerase